MYVLQCVMSNTIRPCGVRFLGRLDGTAFEGRTSREVGGSYGSRPSPESHALPSVSSSARIAESAWATGPGRVGPSLRSRSGAWWRRRTAENGEGDGQDRPAEERLSEGPHGVQAARRPDRPDRQLRRAPSARGPVEQRNQSGCGQGAPGSGSRRCRHPRWAGPLGPAVQAGAMIWHWLPSRALPRSAQRIGAT